MVDAFGVKSYKFFFDRQLVLNRLEKKERNVLSRTGAVGRREIRKRVRPLPKRKRKKRSKYPYWRTNSEGGLRHVLYVYDPSRGSVVVGPQKFNAKMRYSQRNRDVSIRMSARSVPELLNSGGVAVHKYTYRSGSSYSVRKQYRRFPFVEDAVAPTRRALIRNVKTVRF